LSIMFMFCLSKVCNIAGLSTSSGLKFASLRTIAKAVPRFFAAFEPLIQPTDALTARCGKVLPLPLPLIGSRCVLDLKRRNLVCFALQFELASRTR
jgi:hypothetical protein